MQTTQLCLAALQFGEASGYDIKFLFERAFRHFQRSSFGSIYPALNQLAESGLVECRCESQSGRPDKKTYSLTEEGQKEFLEIINTTPPRDSYQSDFLVLILFSRWIEHQRLVNLICEYRQGLEEQKNELDALLKDDQGQLSTEAKFTINFGRHTLSGHLSFLDQNTDALLQHHEQRQ